MSRKLKKACLFLVRLPRKFLQFWFQVFKRKGLYRLNVTSGTAMWKQCSMVLLSLLKLERVNQLANYAQSIGLKVAIYLIMGMPGETREQIWDSFRLAKELGIYTPFTNNR